MADDKGRSTEKIARIIFKAGMLNNIEEASSCEERKLNTGEIPYEIQQIFISDKLTELSGTWGDPKFGSPIQYHRAIVQMKSGKSYEFEVCNLAIMMFHSEDPRIKRLFRFLMQIERHAKKRD
jgi:hypothetical protein